jgi:hypothetical protein
MEFPNAHVKSVKADIAGGEITISFALKLNDDSLEAATALAAYVDREQANVEVRVIPQQDGLFPKVKIMEFRTVDAGTGEILDDEQKEG